ncbi:MAG: hypothetical protein IPM18_08645 [Phycisphaerales bacterium]|nr:hypothetical protein [Phycisphaerales bacterium]
MAHSATYRTCLQRGLAVAYGLLTGLGLVLLTGCREQPAPGRHEVRQGIIESIRAESQEFTVRLDTWPHRTAAAGELIACLLSSDGEIYINDRFSPFESLQPGDEIEMIVYRDRGTPPDRNVVTLASVTRPEPPAPVPDLTLPTTQPTTQPQEN